MLNSCLEIIKISILLGKMRLSTCPTDTILLLAQQILHTTIFSKTLCFVDGQQHYDSCTMNYYYSAIFKDLIFCPKQTKISTNNSHFFWASMSVFCTQCRCIVSSFVEVIIHNDFSLTYIGLMLAYTVFVIIVLCQPARRVYYII